MTDIPEKAIEAAAKELVYILDMPLEGATIAARGAITVALPFLQEETELLRMELNTMTAAYKAACEIGKGQYHAGIEAAAKVDDVRAKHARDSAAKIDTDKEPYRKVGRDCLIELAKSHEATAAIIRALAPTEASPSWIIGACERARRALDERKA